MKNEKNYTADAPVMDARIAKIHPERSYRSMLNSKIFDLKREINKLETRKQIATFLIKHNADEMHELIDQVSNYILGFEIEMLEQ